MLNRTLGDDLLPPLLVTFGLSVIIQNGLLELFTADTPQAAGRRHRGREHPRRRGDLRSACCRSLQFALAVAVIGGAAVRFLSHRARPRLPRHLRRSSRWRSSWASTTATSSRSRWRSRSAVVAIAGVLLAVRANFDPAIGPARLIFGFEAVIIGGLGSLWGTLAGGIILGVAQAIGAHARSGLADSRRPPRLSGRARGAPEGLFPKVRG